MNQREYFAIVAMEECAEVAQRISKLLRFGPDEVQPGKTETNRERVMAEYADLVETMDMAGFPLQGISDAARHAKADKVLKFLDYARRECGTVREFEQPSHGLLIKLGALLGQLDRWSQSPQFDAASRAEFAAARRQLLPDDARGKDA